MLLVFKRGSSNIAMVANTAKLAISNIGFLIPFLAGIYFHASNSIIGEATSKSFSKYDIIALVVLVLGIIIYQIKPELKKTQEYQLLPIEEKTPTQHSTN